MFRAHEAWNATYTASGINKPVSGGLLHKTATYRCDDTRCCIVQFWPPDDEHICSKHIQAWNKLTVKQKFCASSSHTKVQPIFMILVVYVSTTVFITQSNYIGYMFRLMNSNLQDYSLQVKSQDVVQDPSVFTSVKYLNHIICLGKVKVRNV